VEDPPWDPRALDAMDGFDIGLNPNKIDINDLIQFNDTLDLDGLFDFSRY